MKTHRPQAGGRSQAADAKRRDLTRQARRWVVEVGHGGCNRLRKLHGRDERLERSFVALNRSAAIAFRHARLTAGMPGFVHTRGANLID